VIKNERFDKIRNELALRGTVDCDELSVLLDASKATVRRDLDELHQLGELTRTHGGATRRNGENELPFHSKLVTSLEQKRAIAALTASMISDGQVISCTGGTTVFHLVKALKGKAITIVTNAINIAMELAAVESMEVIVTGGTLRPLSYELVGHFTDATIREFHTDIAILGVDGISFERGLSTYTTTEAFTANLFLENSREAWIVADHTKIGKIAPALIAPLSRVKRIITDSGVTAEQVHQFERAGIELLVAPV
jgi:DeoR/GlpR family transcriptional regulator of sugar metabolism